MCAYGRRHDYDLCRIESSLIYEGVMLLAVGGYWVEEGGRNAIPNRASVSIEPLSINDTLSLMIGLS